MTKPGLSRRDFLRASATSTVGLVLAACGASTPPTTGDTTPLTSPGAASSTAAPSTALSAPAASVASTTASAGSEAAASLPAGASKTATILGEGKPYTLSTAVRFFTWSGIPARMLYEPLLETDDDLMPAPGLVESWEVVSPTVTRFTLRPDLQWTDGTPLTTKDILFTFNLAFQKDATTSTRNDFAALKGGQAVKDGTATTVEGVRAIDELTFELETAAPDATIVRTLALRWWAPLPEHVFKDVAPATLLEASELLQPSVTSGPFKLDRIEADKWLELSANPTYWRGQPKLENLTYVFANIGDVVALASQGQFDYGVVRSPDLYKEIAKNASYDVSVVDYIQPIRMQLNCTLPKFADARVRKAFAYAIDRETICSQIYGGAATPQYTDFLDDYLDPSAEVYSFDPEKARALLTEAGWDPNTVVYFEQAAPAAGAPPNPIADAEFAAYQQFLGDVGIIIEPRIAPDTATYSDLIAGNEWEVYQNPHRRYDQYGPLEMKTYLQSEPANFARWSNPEADALVKQVVAETDPDAIAALARQLSVIVARECPYIPIRADQFGIVARKGFSGYTGIGESYYAMSKPYAWDVA